MADFLAGDVVARLRADVSQFNQAIADVLQKLGQLNQASAQVRTQQSQGQQSTTQLTQATTALTSAVTAQTQATAQASGAQRTLVQAVQQNTNAATQAASAHKGAAQAVTQTTQATTQATQATTQSTAALRAQQAALHQTTQATGTASSALQGMLTIAGGIGVATGIGAIAGQLKDLAVETVQVGVRFESLRASLSALGGSTAIGAAQFQTLLDMAQQLGVAFEPLARGFRQLTAAATQAGLPLAEQFRLLDAVTKEARRTGASNEELGRAITALSQVATKGKVSMEELRQQFGEALPTAMAATAKGMGRTTEELTKMVESGTVGFVPFAHAVTRGFEQMQASGGKFVDGTREAFNRVGNAWKELQDTVMKSGLNTYLVTVAQNFQGAIEWVDRWLKAREAARAGAQGPTPEGLQGATPDQTKEITRLQRLIALYEGQQTAGTPAMQEQRQEMVARAKEQLEQVRQGILANTNATADQEKAQAKVTEETNKTKYAQETQVDNLKSLREALDKMRKDEADFRATAAMAPNVYGDPKGTPEQQTTFARARQQALEESVKKTTELARAFPETTVIPPGMRQELAAFDIQVRKYGETIDAIKEKEQAATKAKRDAAAEAKRAAAALAAEVKAAETQALTLDATLERLQGLTRRPDENPAAEAATRVRSQYAAAIAEGEKALVELERSASLRTQRPEALEQYRAVVKALQDASTAQAKLASDEVLKQQIKPLEEIALRYGLVTTEITSQSDHVQELASQYGLATKEAIDLAKAEELAASFTGTERQAAAEKYLQTIRDTIEARQKIEAQVPRLEQEALASAGPGMAAVRGAGVTTDLERQLELLRTPREERVSTRARQQAERKGGTLTPEHEALLAQIREQERLNAIMDVAGQIGDAAAQHITDGLLHIIDGTQRVGEAFKIMAKSILDSFAQILLSESIRGLVRLGLGVLFGALGGGAAGAGASLGGAFFEGAAASGGGGAYSTGFDAGAVQIATPAQGGAIVNKPTTILAGENPGMNPEYVVNTPQMKALMGAAMRAGPSAGGQAAGGGVTIINVSSKQQADQEAARERGMGRQVVMNYIMDDLAAGAGSRIGRGLRAGGH